ncbi:MAG: M20/M25/M40 family metallo-hydrolase, partial [Gemmatimonadota bacterium]
LPPLQPSVISVGIFRSGERFNIIPAEAYLEGTVRTYDEDVRDMIERRMGEILAGVAQAGGGAYEFEYERGTPPTINDGALAEEMVPTLVRVMGGENVHLLDPIMAAEDFAYFANQIPGFYFSLGTTKPGTSSGWNHTPDFMADDSAVPVGMRAMSNLLLDYLNERSEGGEAGN